jgi:urease accessory protein UreF
MRLLRWIADYWYVAFLAVGAVLAVVLLRRLSKDGYNPMDRVRLELSAIEAKRETREIQLQQGHDEAVRHVREKYKTKYEALDAKEAARVAELEKDPEKLAKAMAKIGSE